MNLPRQKLMTDHFLKCLEKEVASAKRSGEYDIGIQTIAGHSVTIEKPRSFCFRGLEAKDERVLLYKVQRDRGMDIETALQLYDEAKALEGEAGNSSATEETVTTVLGGHIRRIKSGFYIDRRDNIFKECPPIRLIVNQGKSSNRCVVIKPNDGKRVYTKDWVHNKLLHGAANLSLCTDLELAKATWKKEFELADRPWSESYQRWSYGRHAESLVFGGSVVPLLNKLLVSANWKGGGLLPDENDTDSHLVMPSVVRVEPSGQAQQPQGEPANDAAEGGEEDANSSAADTSNGSNNDGTPSVGKNVAHEILGNSIFRGVITEVS